MHDRAGTRVALLGAAILNQKVMREYVAAVVAAGGVGALTAIVALRLAHRKLADGVRIHEERTRASRIESLARLAGGVAHDFNDILTAIVGNVSLVRARGMLDRESDDALAQAEEACVRARRLTEQLLAFAKGGTPIRKRLRLESVIRQSVQMARFGSTVDCTMHIEPTMWPVNADEHQLIQVLTNILITVRRTTRDGGRIVIRAGNVTEPINRWEQGLEVAAGPYASVSVSSDAGGIAASEVSRVFEPYNSTTGGGLELATAWSIAKKHRGYIAVESDPGGGMTMRLALPALPAETYEPEIRASEHKPAL
jgi:signal transduction histidine kinase